MGRMKLILPLVVMFLVMVMCQDNATTAKPAISDASGVSGAKVPPKETNKPGALASLAKMFIDIPMGIVEAFKDGAEAIENLVIAFMRGIF